MSRKRVLVLGGSRFVGLHIVFEMLKQGHDVTVLNRGHTPVKDLPPEVHRLVGDRQDPASLEAALKGKTFDMVADTSTQHAPDLRPLLKILSGNVGHYIYCGGTSEYAQSDILPITEESPHTSLEGDTAIHPHNVRLKYYAKKDLLAANQQWQSTKGKAGTPTTVLQPHRIYGPHNYNPDWEMSLFARVERGRPILIPGDGLMPLQWIHVDDLAGAFAAVWGKPQTFGQRYILINNEMITARGFMKVIGSIVGKAPQIVYVPLMVMPLLSRPIYPYNWHDIRIFSSEKLMRDTGWKPQHNTESGLRNAYEWYRKEGLDKWDWDFSYEDWIPKVIRWEVSDADKVRAYREAEEAIGANPDSVDVPVREEQ